jgi:hypothetical protein
VNAIAVAFPDAGLAPASSVVASVSQVECETAGMDDHEELVAQAE